MLSHDPKHSHSTGAADSAARSQHDEQRPIDLHRHLHHLVASLGGRAALDCYDHLHHSLADVIVRTHGGGDRHDHGHHDQVAGLCIADAWHVVKDQEASPEHKVHALETALRHHASVTCGAQGETHAA